MGEIVVAAGASHAPGITGRPENADPEQVSRFYAGMDRIKEAFEAAQPDVIIEIANDHLLNFYLDNIPAICVGVADSYFGPSEEESWLRIPRTTVPGNRDFGMTLVREALNFGFDLAYSEDLIIDHAEMVPLHFITPAMDVPVIPILVNDFVDPMPTPLRAYQLGALIRQVIASRPKDEKVAVLGTGGLSHWVGTPESGLINVEFDERFLEAIDHGTGRAVADWTPLEIGRGGNGAHEIRNWLAVMGALDGVKGEVVAYEPVPQWVTGCGAVIWKL